MSSTRGRRVHNLERSRSRSHFLRWLLPEWHPWFRDWSDVLRLSFLLAVPPLIVLDPPEALRLLLTFLVSLIPRLTATPAAFDLAFNVAWSLQAWGNVSHVFETWLGYHDIVHFALTGATAALFYFVLQRLRLLPDLAHEQSIHQQLGILTLTLAMGTTVNAIYEEYEYFAITMLHMHLLEYYQHDINDLFFGGLGSLAAGLLLVAWSRQSWPTRRPAHGDPLPGLLHGLERRMARTARPERRSAQLAGRSGMVHLDRGARPPAVPRLPKLLAGDWTRAVRDPLDLIRASFAVGMIVAAVQGSPQLAVRFGLTFAAVVAVRALAPPRLFDLLFVVAMAFQAWGDFAHAYSRVGGYANWASFDVALAFALLLYLTFVRFRLFPEFADEPGVHRRLAVFLAAMCLGMSSGAYYELYIWLANHILGAHYQVSWGGLTYRLALDWAGGIAAGALLVAWDVYGWGTRRRLPVARLEPGSASG